MAHEVSKFAVETRLEKKIWYRLIKVIYILLILMLAIFAYIAISNDIPHKVLDYAEISCNLRVFSKSQGILDKNYTFKSTEIELYLYNENISSYDDEQIREHCVNSIFSTSPDLYNRKNLLDEMHYQVKYFYTDQGEWSIAIVNFIEIVLVGLLILEVIRRTFLYIFIGKSFLAI